MMTLPPQSIDAEFEQGSVWDARMLFGGILLVMSAFASTIETEVWQASDHFLIPLLSIGVALVILNIAARIIRPKLRVTLFEIQAGQLKIIPVRNLQFSAWIANKPVMVNISEVSSLKAYDFYSHGSKTGMFWMGLELADKRVIEFNVDNPGLVKDIIAFFKASLPSVELTVDARIDA